MSETKPVFCDTTQFIEKKRGPKPKAPKVRQWTMEIVQNRNVASRLNELSAEGYSIFSVVPSANIGGSYEVLFYIEK
jgi:hypothetical protein